MRWYQRPLMLLCLVLLCVVLAGTLPGCDTQNQAGTTDQKDGSQYTESEVRSMASQYLRQHGRYAPCPAAQQSQSVTYLGNEMWTVTYYCHFEPDPTTGDRRKGTWAIVTVDERTGAIHELGA